MPDRTARGRDLAAYLLVALASLCWAGNHVVGRAIAGHVPPIAISTLRWAVPAVLLLPFAFRHFVHDWPHIVRHWTILVLLALLNGAIFGALQYVGLQYTTAINTSVLNSVAPVLIILAGRLLFGDRVALLQLAGVAISLAGVLTVVTKGDAGVLAALSFNGGDLIIFFNMGVFAVYSALLRRRPPVHWLTFTFLLSWISALASAPVMVIEHLAGYHIRLDATTLAALAYVTVFPSVVAVAAWNKGVDLIGPGRAGALLHLVALYSAVLASVFLGEALRSFHFAGFALILAGVWLAARRG